MTKQRSKQWISLKTQLFKMNSVGDLWRPVRQQVIEESGETDATVKAGVCRELLPCRSLQQQACVLEPLVPVHQHAQWHSATAAGVAAPWAGPCSCPVAGGQGSGCSAPAWEALSDGCRAAAATASPTGSPASLLGSPLARDLEPRPTG